MSEGSQIPGENELLLDITQTELWQKVESDVKNILGSLRSSDYG